MALDKSGDAKLPSNTCDISECDDSGFSEVVEENKPAEQHEGFALLLEEIEDHWIKLKKAC